MVTELQQTKAIVSEPVRRAFLGVPREAFVPEVAAAEGLESVYRADAALITATDRRGAPISSSSAPSIMAPMLEALTLTPALRVLEVGAGTGYNAALLAVLVGPAGQVTSIDVDPAIAKRARAALRSWGAPVRVITGDGRNGLPAAAPFDRIIVTASGAEVARAWRDQLVDGGHLVMPLRFGDTFIPQAVVAFRREGDKLRSTAVIPGFFMAMRSPGEAGPSVPQERQLVLSVSGGGGPGRAVVSLAGPALDGLTPAAQRRAAVTMLSPPRRVRSLSGEHATGFVYFLHLLGHRHVVSCTFDGTFGAGVLSPKATGLAAVTRPPGARGRVEGFGDVHAEEQLITLLDDWASHGKPTLEDLTITVTYKGEEPPPNGWRTIERDHSIITLDWRKKRAE